MNDKLIRFALAVSLVTSTPIAHAAPGEGDGRPPHVTVIKTAPELVRGNIETLAQTFRTRGTTAVADELRAMLADPKQLESWRQFVNSGDVKVVDFKLHPNEQKAVEWMNTRFERMGITNLQFGAEYDKNLPDPTAIDDRTIGPKKWLRYLGGPGIAAVAFYFGLPTQTAASTSDYLYLIIPGLATGVATIGLELLFAWPKANNRVWKRVWKFGSHTGSAVKRWVVPRLTMTMVNFVYGMALYGAGVGGAHLPTLFGGEVVPTTAPGLLSAISAAAIGAVTFTAAMGQFQSNIAKEEERGSITANTRYGLETTGVVVNNGARVASWVLPAGSAMYTLLAQAGFFILKTFPQLLKTDVVDRLSDRRIARLLRADDAPKTTFFERCANALGGLELINLPRLEKQMAH